MRELVKGDRLRATIVFNNYGTLKELTREYVVINESIITAFYILHDITTYTLGHEYEYTYIWYLGVHQRNISILIHKENLPIWSRPVLERTPDELIDMMIFELVT